MANKKKHVVEVIEIAEEPAIIAGTVEQPSEAPADSNSDSPSGNTDSAPADANASDAPTESANDNPAPPALVIPLATLKEINDLINDSYNRSNNVPFRQQCQRLRIELGRFITDVENSMNNG